MASKNKLDTEGLEHMGEEAMRLMDVPSGVSTKHLKEYATGGLEIVKDDGGWMYGMSPDGSIEILTEGAGGRGTAKGKILTKGKAYNAIKTKFGGKKTDSFKEYVPTKEVETTWKDEGPELAALFKEYVDAGNKAEDATKETLRAFRKEAYPKATAAPLTEGPKASADTWRDEGTDLDSLFKLFVLSGGDPKDATKETLKEFATSGVVGAVEEEPEVVGTIEAEPEVVEEEKPITFGETKIVARPRSEPWDVPEGHKFDYYADGSLTESEVVAQVRAAIDPGGSSERIVDSYAERGGQSESDGWWDITEKYVSAPVGTKIPGLESKVTEEGKVALLKVMSQALATTETERQEDTTRNEKTMVVEVDGLFKNTYRRS
mgnify:CR=1 FL=1